MFRVSHNYSLLSCNIVIYKTMTFCRELLIFVSTIFLVFFSPQTCGSPFNPILSKRQSTSQQSSRFLSFRIKYHACREQFVFLFFQNIVFVETKNRYRSRTVLFRLSIDVQIVLFSTQHSVRLIHRIFDRWFKNDRRFVNLVAGRP